MHRDEVSHGAPPWGQFPSESVLSLLSFLFSSLFFLSRLHVWLRCVPEATQREVGESDWCLHTHLSIAGGVEIYRAPVLLLLVYVSVERGSLQSRYLYRRRRYATDLCRPLSLCLSVSAMVGVGCSSLVSPAPASPSIESVISLVFQASIHSCFLYPHTILVCLSLCIRMHAWVSLCACSFKCMLTYVCMRSWSDGLSGLEDSVVENLS